MNFPEYKQLDYAALAEEILAFWEANHVFEASVALREGATKYTFYEGPPSANGTPGIHHVMARTIKDIFCRYQTLKGKQVKRKGGWDTHGLPIELQVEKELGITKDDIGTKISIAEYNAQCRQTVMRFTDQWLKMTNQMGYWVDMDDPYVTYQNRYIEAVWDLLQQLYNKNLLYKGYTIQPYSPAAGTGLSSHELNMPGTYKEVKDVSIVAQFKAIDFPDFEGEVYILAWTTTPWTLPANTALTVGKNIDYQIINTFNPYTFLPVNVLCAKERVAAYFKQEAENGDFEAYKSGDKLIPWKVVGAMKGEALEGVRYEQLLPYIQPEGDAFRVILGDFVTTEDGTGVVHTSPNFGADDFRVAQQNGIPSIMVKDASGKDVPIVNRQGRFVKEITDFALEPVKEQYLSDEEREAQRKIQGRDKYLSVDERIGIKLKTENKAFNVQKFDHPYPHCWRTDKPILYYPMDSWFIRTTAVKDRLVALNKTINWKPESTGTGRFGNWLENLVDWNLSRSRYWGTPLPIWRNEDGTAERCIGSIAELRQAASDAVVSGLLSDEEMAHNQAFIDADETTLDLHRPYVDTIFLVGTAGQVLRRETDLIDVWFDSGAMPFAQWGLGGQPSNEFPADFISEGVDQTRGWFFTLHAIAGMISDSVAFKNVVSTGLLLDKDGEKMSKRKGNVINPFEAMQQYGTDPIRWYIITNSNPWDNLKFNLEGVTEIRNKFFGTLTNTYNFFALYANLDGYSTQKMVGEPTELDRWILSKLHTLVAEIDGYYADYEPTKAGRAIQNFVGDHLSNWYVRLSRRRFWKGDLTPDKQAAYQTLETCLRTVAQLMSPIAPFYADWLYRNLRTENEPISVHLTDFYVSKNEEIFPALEASMELAQRVSSLVHSIRKVNKLKVRQPLGKVLVPVLNPDTQRQLEAVAGLIAAEVNVKEVLLLDDTSGILNKKVKPNFKALGPKFGKNMKPVADLINAMSKEELALLEDKKEIVFGDFTIQITDVEILTEDLPGFLTAQDGDLTVALDINITPELRDEGIAREFVNRIQNLRKELGFEVSDKISLKVLNSPLNEALTTHRDFISVEVQAREMTFVDILGEGNEISLDEELLTVAVAKI